MVAPLIPCSSCFRHVRSTEVYCPFCHAPTPTRVARTAPAVATTGNAGRALSRAALALVGAAAIAGCSKTPKQLDASAADASAADQILAVPPYGASLVELPEQREARLQAEREQEAAQAALNEAVRDAGKGKKDAGLRPSVRPPYGAPGIDRDPSRF